MAAALKQPARPLFLGRKCCIPSRPIFQRIIETSTVAAALAEAAGRSRRDWIATTAAAEWPGKPERILDAHERKNWRTGLHGGSNQLAEGPLKQLREEDS